VRLCVLRLGPGFPAYGDKQSRSAEFFARVARKDFGFVYEEVPNLSGLSPRECSGPYFVSSFQLTIESESPETAVNSEQRSSDGRDAEAQRHTGSMNGSRPRSVGRQVPQRGQAEVTRETESITPATAENARNGASPKPAVETVTAALVRENGLYPGTTGVFLNESAGGLPAGVVVETIQHRVIRSDSDFYAAVIAARKAGQVVVGIWRKAPGQRWERNQIVIALR